MFPGTRTIYSDPTQFFRDYKLSVDGNGPQFDRIGPHTGKYLGVMQGGKADAFEDRSLPISSLRKEYHQFTFPPRAIDRLAEDGIRIEISTIAPAFGRAGGGLQVRFLDSKDEAIPVDQLIREDYLS